MRTIESTQNKLEAILDKLKSDQRVVVFTGAGVSAESGIPTFRNKFDGLWTQYSVDDVASADGFKANPKLVWDWHADLRKKILDSAPNPAHQAIALMETMLPEFTLITQNIDGLHQRAGNTKVIELHGNIHKIRCHDRCTDENEVSWETYEYDQPCPHCGGKLRPDVVWFGESLSKDSYGKGKEAVRKCTLLFCIGTSSVIYPAASFPFEAAHRGAMVVQINPNATELDLVTPYVFRGKAGDVMPMIVNAAWPEKHLK
jgi:NAD-dependent deacetylase